jgi:predicted AAA+ superfamily ATPase
MDLDIITKSKSLLSQDIKPRRFYYDQLETYLQTNQIVVIQWQRRVGKSSIALWYLKEKKVNLDRIFFVNKELDVNNSIDTVKALNTLFEQFVKAYGEPEYIVIDEIQDIEDRERFVRAMFAYKKYKIIITWSNSHLLSWELTTYLTGRYLAFDVYPLGYDEFLLFTDQPNNRDSFALYSRYGWMPEMVKMNNPISKIQYLELVKDTIFMKDIVKRFTIKDVSYLEKVLAYISDIIGSEMSLRNMHNASKQFGRWEDASLSKLSNYVQMLQIPYMIHKVWRFDIHGKKNLDHNEKYYFNDIGLRNSIKFKEDDDKAKILENIVFLHLKRYGYKVYVGNYNGKEIDFVAQKWQELVYIQVARIITSEKTAIREFDNLLTIKDGFDKLVVSMDSQFMWKYNGIKQMQILDFLTQFT